MTLARCFSALALVLTLRPRAVHAQDAGSPPGATPAPDAGEPTQEQPPPTDGKPAGSVPGQTPPPQQAPVIAPGHWYNIPYAPEGPISSPMYGTARPEAPRITRVWYGWQTLIADGATFAVFLFGALQDRGEGQVPFLVIGSATWFLAPPIVHWAHGKVGTGFGSLGLRILPGLFVPAFVVCVYDKQGGVHAGDCTNEVSLLAFFTGVGVIALDAAVLAYDERKAEEAQIRRAPTAASRVFWLGPWRDARSGAWGLNLRATF